MTTVVLWSLFLIWGGGLQDREKALERAMASVARALPRATQDQSRPVFHFRPPANWMNDPNGTLYHEGVFHLFYQHNPYGDEWGHMHWGHAQSRDLVSWEHLPIALWPSLEEGEEHCFSGAATVTEQGQPLLFYTSVAANEARPNQQWGAVGDEQLVKWKKMPQNPILTVDEPGMPAVEGSWRDPFLFREGSRVFMVVAANLEPRAAVLLFEAEDNSLRKWAYRSVLFEVPRNEIEFLECPNFFRLDDRYVLIASPYDRLLYWTGDFDLNQLKFLPDGEARILDHGKKSTAHFYASNVAWEGGRTLLFGWVRGFPAGRGWNGALALPRQIELDPEGALRQLPVPELRKLRRTGLHLDSTVLRNETRDLRQQGADTLELTCEVALTGAVKGGVRLLRSSVREGVEVAVISGGHLKVGDQMVKLKGSDRTATEIHLFLDRSVLEVYAEGGRTVVTQVVDWIDDATGIQLFAEDGSAEIHNFRSWSIEPIWTE